MNLILICLFAVNVAFIEQTTYIKNSNTSQNGEYTIAANYIPGSEGFREEVFLYKNNNLVWSQVFEGKHHFCIGNTGAVVSLMHYGFDAILEFYDQNGALHNSVKVPFSHGGNFTKDGRIFFFLSGTDGLSAYDQTGHQLHNFGICHKYAVSYDGSIVAVINENRLIVYEHNKPSMEFAVPSMHVRSMIISDDGSVLAFIDSQNLYVYNLSNGAEKFTSSIKKPKILAISSDGGLIAVAGEERHITSHITVQLFNLENEVIWEWSRILEHEYETVHRIDFTDDSELHIYATDDLFRFSIR